MSPASEEARSEEMAARWLLDRLPLRLGSYELRSLLGKGGMGMVFKGHHLLLDQPVAIKILHPDLSQTDRFVTRFHREMATFGQLKPHPNLVRALYAGEESGIFYLAMEYVEGQTLEWVVRRRGALPERVACEVVRQAALGLEAIREAGLVHRDIKPANLMLADDGLIKILDMGLVRLREPAENMPELTGTGVLLGTLNYLAPEQAIDPRKVDIRADIYSLGCTLYHLLTGEPPYKEHASSASKIHAHAYLPFPAVGRAIDPSLARMLARMTQKDPGDRPSTPQEVADVMATLAVAVDLTPCLEGPAAGDVGSVASDAVTADRSRGRTSLSSPAPKAEFGLEPSPRPQAGGLRSSASGAFRRAAFVALAVVCGASLVYGIYSAIPPSLVDDLAGSVVRPDPVDPIVAAGSEAASLDELAPYEPHNLLARAPVQAVWDRGDGTAFRTYDTVRKQLIVSSPKNSLFHLGKIEAHSFTLQFQIKQTRWTGGPGIYLGFRESAGVPAGKVFQYLRFGERPLPDGKNTYTLVRGTGLLRVLNGSNVFDWGDRASVDIVQPQQEAWLILEIVHHHLHAVRLNGSKLDKLTRADVDCQFRPADYQGRIGLSNSSSSCVFEKASLTLVPER